MNKYELLDNELDRIDSSFTLLVSSLLEGQERVSTQNRDLLVKLLEENGNRKYDVYTLIDNTFGEDDEECECESCQPKASDDVSKE